MRRIILAGTLASALATALTVSPSRPQAQTRTLRFSVTLPSGPGLIDGRLLVMIAKDAAAGEPRFQINDSVSGQLIFGLDIDGAKPGSVVTLDGSAIGFPLSSINDIPAGMYSVQALVHKYETFKRASWNRRRSRITAARCATATAPSTAGTAMRPGRTHCRDSATTRCTSRKAWRACSRQRPLGPTSRAGGIRAQARSSRRP